MVVFVATEPPGLGVLKDRCSERHCDPWVRFQIERYDDVTTPWNALMHSYAEQHPDLAAYVSVTGTICRSNVSPCDDTIDGVLARIDGTHYRGIGQDTVVKLLLDLFEPVLVRQVRASAATTPAGPAGRGT
jgi:hypothetical protein